MKSTLREPRTGRLRASLRGVIPAVVTVLVSIGAMLAIPALLGQVFPTITPASVVVLFFSQWVGIYLVPIGIAVWLAMRLDRSSLARFGLDIDRQWLSNFGWGVGISLTVVAIWMSYVSTRGLYGVHPERITDFGEVSLWFGLLVVGLALGFTLLGNVWEEIVFRGIMLQNFAEGLTARGFSPLWAIGLASVGSVVLFGLYHIVRGPIMMFLSMPTGFVFALAYLLTGRLGFAIGIHFGRFPMELFRGEDLDVVSIPEVLEIGQVPLIVSLESLAFETILSVVLILAWAYLTTGEISIADRIYHSDEDVE